MGKQSGRQLEVLLNKGGEFAPEQLEQVIGAAREADFAVYTADCSKARNRSAVFRAVVKAVDYPQFFGSSFEGFYDCLCDAVSDQRTGVVLVMQDLHSADPDIEKDLEQLSQTLGDVVDSAAEQQKAFLYCVLHGGKHADDQPGIVHNWSAE